MIVFDVTCSNGHTFEGWFPDSAAFAEQSKAGEVLCPVCGDSRVEKGLQAPRLGNLRKAKADAAPVAKSKAAMGGGDPGFAQHLEALHALKKHVEEKSDYVGEKFPEEARKIHYGETEPRSIYGEATTEEAAELADEGVEFARIPWPSKPDA